MDKINYTELAKKRKKGEHLKFNERGAIEQLFNMKYSMRKIASSTGIPLSTVRNEIIRGKKDNGEYSANVGQRVYLKNRSSCHRPSKLNRCDKFVQWTISQVKKNKWSFDACVGFARKIKLFSLDEMVSTKSLYNALHARLLPLSMFDLPIIVQRQHKKRAVVVRPHKRLFGRSIDERPDVSSEFGHWEIDTVIGCKSNDPPCVLTLLEKQSRYYIALKIPQKTSNAVMDVL